MAPNGHVSVSFFAGPMERSPYFAAMNTRLGEILPETLEFTRHAFRLDGKEVATMFRSSGLQNVLAETLEIATSLPPVDEFLPMHVAALPFASDFAALDQGIRESFYTDVRNDLAAFVQPAGNLLAPLALHLVSGQK